jgi:hypothetical protein
MFFLAQYFRKKLKTLNTKCKSIVRPLLQCLLFCVICFLLLFNSGLSRLGFTDQDSDFYFNA